MRKKILSVILAVTVLLSALSSLMILAENTVNEVYISQNGSGDGLSAANPATYAKGMELVANGGTVYVIGKVSNIDGTLSNISSPDKDVNFRGIKVEGKDAPTLVAPRFFEMSGKLSFDDLAFEFSTDMTYDFSFRFQNGSDNDVTFGPNVTFPEWQAGKGFITFLKENSTNKLTINSGKHSTILVGGFQNTQTVNSTDITLNAGEVSTMAIANGWVSGNIGQRIWTGNYSYTINGGIVSKIVGGHLNGMKRTTKGVVKTTVNGGQVDEIFIGAEWKEENSTGLRLIEINGGSVGKISAGKETSSGVTYKSVVILNNGMASQLTSVAPVNTLIKASKGGKVTAKLDGSSILGYEITNEKNYLWIDGVLAEPNPETGLYTIGEGTHTVDFTDRKILGMETVYASQNGEGSGETAEEPMAFSDAMDAVKDNGTIYVIGEVKADSIINSDKAISFVGMDKAASIFKADELFNLGGKLSFDNITFKTDKVSDFLFLMEKETKNEITFGENVVLPSSGSNYHIAFNKDKSSNKLVINNAADFNNIYAGGYNNGGLMAIDKTDIIVNNENAVIDNLAVAHGYNQNGKWSGNYKFTVNAGKISNVVLGHTFGLPRTLQGTMYAEINGGTIGKVQVGPLNSENGGTGLRIAEINGGNITSVKASAKTGGATVKSIVILNNGMADKIVNPVTDSFNTLIKVSEGGRVSAVVENNSVKGYEIEIPAGKYVTLNGKIIAPDSSTGLYTIPEGNNVIEFKTALDYVYASANGTGDGTSEDKPTTLAIAMATVKDGGIIYIVGRIETSDDAMKIGSLDKAINFIGTDKDKSVFKAGNRFLIVGKVSFDNLTFKVVNLTYDFSFYSEKVDYCDITFGENVIFPSWPSSKGYMAILNSNSINKISIGAGKHSIILAGGYNSSLSGVNTDITVNGGEVGGIAVANGWNAGGWNANDTWSGKFNFTVNGGSVGEIVLGHWSGGLRTTHGVATAVINGGSVNTLYMGARNRDRLSSGLRIAEINGGSVGSIVNSETPVSSSYKTIVILNNGMADKVGSMAEFNTVINAAEGGKVSAVVEGNELKGYTITTDKKYILIDGTIGFADPQTGLYAIGSGEHEVEFVDEIPDELRAIKVNTGAPSKFGQWVKLKADTEYVFSFYYTEQLENVAYVLHKDIAGNQSFGSQGMYVDDKKLYKEIVFTPTIDDYTEETLKDFGLKPNGKDVMVYIGLFPSNKESGYFYSPALYERSDSSKTNLFEDVGFYRAVAEKNGGKWYDINLDKANVRFISTAFNKIEGGLDAFNRPKTPTSKGNTVIYSNGKNNPYLFQRVSLTPGKTYVLSSYTSPGALGNSIWTHYTAEYEKAQSKLVTRSISDKKLYKTTTYFKVPQIGEYGAVEDLSKPGNVFMYIGTRATKNTSGYLYDIQLYEQTDASKTNILVDTDFSKIGYCWYQKYWEGLDVFSTRRLSSLEGGIDYFTRPYGEDISVPEGPKMMSYFAQSGSAGKMTLELPSTLEIGDTGGKNYVVSFYLRPVEGRDPTAFYSSDYDGNPQLIEAAKVEGYKYTFHIKQTYNFFLQLQIEGRHKGYITGLEMYEADEKFNIIGTKNEATFFGKDGTFSDWTIQPGYSWIILEGSFNGTYPGAPAKNFTGPWTGELVPIPAGYFEVEDSVDWWKTDSEATETGSVSGKLLSSSGAALSGKKIRLVGVENNKLDFSAKTGKDGSFSFKDIPIGKYELYVSIGGMDIRYADIIELSKQGDTADITLNYYETADNQNQSGIVTSGCIIKGKFADPDGNPLEGLTFLLEPYGLKVTSDANGEYIFEGVQAGSCELYIIAESGKKVLVTALELADNGVYELTLTGGKPVIYDPETETVSFGNKKPSGDKQTSNEESTFPWLIIVAAILALAAIAGVIIILLKRKKKSQP